MKTGLSAGASFRNRHARSIWNAEVFPDAHTKAFRMLKMSLTEFYECDKLNGRQVTGPFFFASVFLRESKLEGRKIIIGGEKPCVQG